MSARAPLLLGIDEGTTAVKAALFDVDLRPVAEARRPVTLRHPAPGWVEQDPSEIEHAVVDAVGEVLEARAGRAVLASGLDHQGESVLAWDADSGRAISPVIVWQDKRSEPLLRELGEDVVRRSGLPLDPYFSAGKLAWLLRHDAAVAAAAERGVLRFGTVDAFLSERLGAGAATDLSTASRTQLLALGGRDWDPWLCDRFGVPIASLPALHPTYGALGTLRHPRWPIELALHARVVDQQAALAGAGCRAPRRRQGDLRNRRVRARAGRAAPPFAGSGLLARSPGRTATRSSTPSTAACSRPERSSTGWPGTSGSPPTPPPSPPSPPERRTAEACGCSRRSRASARRGGGPRRAP